MSEQFEVDLDSTEPAECIESVERLYLYLDGELTEERRKGLEAYLRAIAEKRATGEVGHLEANDRC